MKFNSKKRLLLNMFYLIIKFILTINKIAKKKTNKKKSLIQLP